ncbi:hypothetical protein FA10DRAFT_65492 [Acaromyces ingoldii]|uniref:Uncharacterized protein n=1 Tax=Acaromyces ingoldii TaxID=215250 RepID=A0A316YRR1_9BASI|nr:hypothetical protein FA10DRAFT_65492 [Acaromyces ingoldii]PWN91358.1 hypothetical protein FA10DRAFT_65492 [Acaromyces ingoldii]
MSTQGIGESFVVRGALDVFHGRGRGKERADSTIGSARERVGDKGQVEGGGRRPSVLVHQRLLRGQGQAMGKGAEGIAARALVVGRSALWASEEEGGVGFWRFPASVRSHLSPTGRVQCKIFLKFHPCPQRKVWWTLVAQPSSQRALETRSVLARLRPLCHFELSFPSVCQPSTERAKDAR